VTLGACGFNVAPKEIVDDAGRTVRTWTLDSATELAGETTAMTIDPRGSLTPDGYVYGALLARGVEGVKLWSNADTDWSKTAAQNPTTYGLWQGNPLDVSKLDLGFVGIANTQMVSVWFEGELWIDAGSEKLRIRGDDTAFAYVALDGKSFTTLIPNGMAATTIAVQAAGWYPVRIGWADGDNNGDVQLEKETSPGQFADLDYSRFRVATSGFRGMHRTVYYREVRGGGTRDRLPITSIQQTPLHDATSFAPPLVGSTTSSNTPFDWSARWAGQFYAAAAGSYTVRAETKDGCSIQLGTAAPVADNYQRNAAGASICNATATLAPGWNDLIVDFTHVDMTPAFSVKLTSAPGADLALVGAPLPLDRLRPIEPSADRVITRSMFNAGQIADNQMNTFTTRSVTIDAAGANVRSTDITVRVVSPAPNQLRFRLSTGTSQQQRNMIIVADPNGGNDAYIAQAVFDLQTGGPAAGTWSLGISDTSGMPPGGNSSFEELHLTMHTSGGREQIAKRALWRSSIRESETTVSQIDSVKWTERVADGATITVRMRSCAMADCSDGAWSEPLANGASPALPANRYLQLEVEMTSDGTHEPELEKLEVQYRADR
jgi:hypothetical protein